MVKIAKHASKATTMAAKRPPSAAALAKRAIRKRAAEKMKERELHDPVLKGINKLRDPGFRKIASNGAKILRVSNTTYPVIRKALEKDLAKILAVVLPYTEADSRVVVLPADVIKGLVDAGYIPRGSTTDYAEIQATARILQQADADREAQLATEV